MGKSQRAFTKWLASVDEILRSLDEPDSLDLPDFDWREWFDKGAAPAWAVRQYRRQTYLLEE